MKKGKTTEVLDLNRVKYVLQRCNRRTGEWHTYGMPFTGKKMALVLLNRQKEEDPQHDWRVVPKVVADAYRQGYADALWAVDSRWLTQEDIRRRLLPLIERYKLEELEKKCGS